MIPVSNNRVSISVKVFATASLLNNVVVVVVVVVVVEVVAVEMVVVRILVFCFMQPYDATPMV